MVMGKNVFSDISENLVPFREALAGSVKRRALLFQNFPEAMEVVKTIPLKDLIEPLLAPPMSPDTSLMDVLQAINSRRLDFVYIVDDQQRLIGLVTRTDLMRWVEVIAAQPGSNPINSTVKDLMAPAPITVTNHDDTACALSMMKEHGYKRILVVDKDTRALVGLLRIENIMESVLLKVAGKAALTAEPAARA
jgi:CBS domain-containing protein